MWLRMCGQFFICIWINIALSGFVWLSPFSRILVLFFRTCKNRSFMTVKVPEDHFIWQDRGWCHATPGVDPYNLPQLTDSE